MMPKIGMRIIKSSLAVFCCFLISFLRESEGIVFYSCIAAVLCIQQDFHVSKRVGLNRIKGTLIGGFFGIIMLLLEQFFLFDSLLVRYALISFMIIPIIYVTVLLNVTQASYISCVVFMSITVSHAFDINPYLFTYNRMLDTIIGIMVALVINRIHMPHGHHQKTMFLVNLDHVLMNDDEITSYTKIMLNRLIEQGANIVLATHRSPATFLPLIKEIPLQMPVITMNGAAVFDLQKQEYANIQPIASIHMKQLQRLFKEHHINKFTHVLRHHILHVYYNDFQNLLEEEYYHRVRKTPYKSLICEEVPEQGDVVYMYAIEAQSRVMALYEVICQSDLADSVNIRIKSDALHPAYTILELYSHNATKGNSAAYLMQNYRFERLYEFVNDPRDLCNKATQTYMFTKEACDLSHPVIYMDEADENAAVHRIDRLFHSRIKP